MKLRALTPLFHKYVMEYRELIGYLKLSTIFTGILTEPESIVLFVKGGYKSYK